MEIERVGEANACERLVISAHEVMKNGFNVDGGNVVGQQDNFVGVDFVLVFVGQLLFTDQAALQQSCDEGAGAGEGIENMHILATQALTKLVLQGIVDAIDNKINHFNGGVHNAQPFGHFWEGIFKELVVEFNNDALLTGGIINARRPHFYAVVKLVQRLALFLQVMGFQYFQYTLYGE